MVGRAGTAAAVSTRVEIQFVNAGMMHPTGIPPDAFKEDQDRVHRYTSTGEIVSAARHKSYRPCCAAEGAGIRNGDLRVTPKDDDRFSMTLQDLE